MRISDWSSDVCSSDLFKMRQLLALGVDAQHGQIDMRISGNHLGLELATVGQRHDDFGGTVDDMVVGDDHAIGLDDHAGTERPGNTLARLPLRRQVAEELAKERIVKERRGLRDRKSK